jgi:site-specific recombinase XerD
MKNTAPKPVGRPKGSIDRVLQDREFGLDQFIAAKSFLMGIDPLSATKRYLLTDDSPTTTEAAVRKIAQIMHRVAARGASRRHGPEASSSQNSVIAAQAIEKVAVQCMEAVKKLAADRIKQRAEQQAAIREKAEKKGLRVRNKRSEPQRPIWFQNMTEFEAWYDRKYRPDFELDAMEMQAQFEEHLASWYEDQGIYYEPDFTKGHNQFAEFGQSRATNTAAKASFCNEDDRRLASRLFPVLQWTVERSPDVADHVSAWVSGTTLEALRKADIFTLYTLCDMIKKRGKNWWREVPKLGPVRAQRIHAWINEVGVQGSGLTNTAFESIQRRRLREVMENERLRPAPPSLQQCQLEPLAPYLNRIDLNGSTGLFRSKLPSMLKAETDIDAIVVILGKYADKKKTLTIYAREICRYFLWAYQELGQPVSSLGIMEARRYREFLGAIPSHWISTSPSPAPRNTAEWKPFRGQLDQASQRKALTSINVILGQLFAAGYLTGNPMAGVLKQAELARPQIDVSRSLSLEQWNFSVQTLDAEIANAEKLASDGKTPFGGDNRPTLRRLKALLHVLYSTGLRRDELHKARLGDLEKIIVDGQMGYLLKVVGKRSKARQALIEPHIMELVLQHVADRPAAFGDDLNSKQGRDKIPLISVLRDAVTAYQREADVTDQDTDNVERGMVLAKRGFTSPDGALSADAMLSAIRGFFMRCAPLASEVGIDREAFDRATLHWMRHTFGHTMMDAEVDIRVVQKSLGHVNINTTALYSKADTEQMVRGLRMGVRNTKATTAVIDGTQTIHLQNEANSTD